jgi:hypothetical protein
MCFLPNNSRIKRFFYQKNIFDIKLTNYSWNIRLWVKNELFTNYTWIIRDCGDYARITVSFRPRCRGSGPLFDTFLIVCIGVSFGRRHLVRIIKNLLTSHKAGGPFSSWAGGGVGCWPHCLKIDSYSVQIINEKCMIFFLVLWMKIRWEWAAYDDRWQIINWK